MNKKMPSDMNINGFKNITVAELQAMMKQGGLRLVDVRTDAEVARGKIPQGESLPLHLLPMRLNEMDKSSTAVFYCQMGGRSAQAAAFAAANGFVDVYNLQGGITAWAQAGLPIEP
jgi:rhodanese-related sulfurtransferase